VLPDTLRFEAVDSDHPMAVRGQYKGQWPGVVRIHIPWTDAEQVNLDPIADISGQFDKLDNGVVPKTASHNGMGS